MPTPLPCGRKEGRSQSLAVTGDLSEDQIACAHSQNAKVNGGIAGASQSSSRAALKGVYSTAIIRPVMMHLLIKIHCS